MLIVADTSPLNYLLLIDRIELLPAIFGTVTVPAAVLSEMTHLEAPTRVSTWAKSPPTWCVIDNTPFDKSTFPIELGIGEVAAITVARAKHADSILLDDLDAREFASAEGFHVIGVLGVLIIAAERRLTDFRTALNQLRSETSYRIAQSQVNHAESILKRKGLLPND